MVDCAGAVQLKEGSLDIVDSWVICCWSECESCTEGGRVALHPPVFTHHPSTVQYSTAQYSTVQYSAVHSRAALYRQSFTPGLAAADQRERVTVAPRLVTGHSDIG